MLMLLLLMRIPVADPPVDWCTVLAMAVTVVVVVTTLFSWSILVTVWSTVPKSLLSVSSLGAAVAVMLLLLARRLALVTAANFEGELVGSLSIKLPLLLFFGFKNITLGSITTGFLFARLH